MKITSFNDAKGALRIIRQRMDRLNSVAAMPGLLKIAEDGNGDKIAVWYNEDGQEQNINLSEQERLVQSIEKKFGKDALKSRSGATFRLELPWMR